MKIAIKTILALILFCAGLLVSAEQRAANVQNANEIAPDIEGSYVYIHTSRNSPTYLQSGTKIELSVGKFVKAEGLSVECTKAQVVTLIFANRFAMYVKGPAKFKIVKFEQQMPFDMSFSDISEASPSRLDIDIDYGEFYVSSPTPRATSRTILKTPCGIFEPRSEAFKLECDDKESALTIMEGQSLFCAIDGKTDFIQQKEIGIVEKKQSKDMYPLKINTLSMTAEQKIKNEISLCRIAIDSLLFSFDKNGKLKAERLTPKEFLIKSTKYDFRR